MSLYGYLDNGGLCTSKQCHQYLSEFLRRFDRDTYDQGQQYQVHFTINVTKYFASIYLRTY